MWSPACSTSSRPRRPASSLNSGLRTASGWKVGDLAELLWRSPRPDSASRRRCAAVWRIGYDLRAAPPIGYHLTRKVNGPARASGGPVRDCGKEGPWTSNECWRARLATTTRALPVRCSRAGARRSIPTPCAASIRARSSPATALYPSTVGGTTLSFPWELIVPYGRPMRSMGASSCPSRPSPCCRGWGASFSPTSFCGTCAACPFPPWARASAACCISRPWISPAPAA